MAKLERDALLAKISEKVTDEALAIELMEDVTDSMNVDSSKELEDLKKELEDKNQAYVELQSKYKERFLSGAESPKEEPVPEPQIKKYVDITDI